MKHWRKGLKRITAVALAVMMIGTTVDASALAVLAAEEAECTCETDDPAFHATNCPAYIAPENPQCYCAEKCTEDTLNIWCDVCGVQGVSACQGTDTAATYAETPDFSTAKVLTAVDGALYIDGVALTINTDQFGNTSVIIPEGNYKLTGDIATDAYIRTEGSINLDLNGYTWDMSAKYLSINDNVTLSLYDTSVNKKGKITTSSQVYTIYLIGSGSTFNLYSGTVENTSDSVNAYGVSSDNGSSNLYGGTIKSNAYAVFYYLPQNITINIDNTSLVCGNGHAQISALLIPNGEPCAVIDVSDYTGGALTVDADINKAGKIKIFTGIQSEQDAENYTFNFICDDHYDFFKEKEEYEEDGGNKYVYVSVPSFTTQPTEENLYTVAFNHPDATLQWCEKTVFDSATYTEDEDPAVVYEVNAGDALIVSLSECSDDFTVFFGCSYNEEALSMPLNSSRKTASVTFDSACSVAVNFMPSPLGNGEYKIEHVRWTELEGETGVQLSKTECETTYVCKATVGEREYCSDEVTIEQEHSYTCTHTSDNVITKKCDTCGKSGTLTIEAEDGIYDGTTAYGATVEKTGIFENEEVTVNYYQGDTFIGTDAPVDAGTYTAKITYEEVTASVTYMIRTIAEMFTYIESVVYDGTEKSANVVVKDGITGIGAITNIKYYQNGEATTPVNAGEYTVKIDVADGDIYDADTDIEVGTFEITKATPPALTIPTATTITYGEKLSASTLSDSSWAWVDGTIVPNVSDYYNAYIEVDDSNYNYTEVEGYDSASHRVVRSISVIVNKATLTVAAKSYTIKVGEALPTYEYTVTGLVGNDTLPVDVTVSCSATDSNTVDTYPITISGVVSDNILASHYVINYVDGTLTISEKDTQEITADDITLTYGETGKKISATTNGDGAITYTVATGTDVISVAADGTITVLKAGTATVTIRAAETADYAEAIKTISVTVSACSHSYTSKVTKQPSYTEKGERTYTCNCGHSYTEEIPKLQPSSGGNNGGGGGTSGSGTPEPTATPIPTATPKPTVTPKPTPAPEKLPHIQDEDGKSGWDVIGDEIEKVIEDAKDSEEKAVVTVDMNGVTKVPKDIFEQIAGKDVSVEFIIDNGLMWTVNGKTVNTEDLKEIDFAVTVESEENPIDSIPVKVINMVTGEWTSIEIQLAHSGEFGFEAVLTVDLEEKNAGLYANLFFYNEDAEGLEFICADVIAKDGTADMTFTHASDYLIVLSETSMEPKEEGKEPEVKEPVLMKGYAVQIGAFSSEANAKKWEQKGEAINIPMFIIKDGKLFKVQTDVFETGEEATEASKKLAAAGLTNFILKTERLVTPEGEETPEVPTKPTKPETPALPENPEKKSIENLAKEVIAGKWGNGTDRKDRLTKAGYDYREVQNKVNELLQ